MSTELRPVFLERRPEVRGSEVHDLPELIRRVIARTLDQRPGRGFAFGQAGAKRSAPTNRAAVVLKLPVAVGKGGGRRLPLLCRVVRVTDHETDRSVLSVVHGTHAEARVLHRLDQAHARAKPN